MSEYVERYLGWLAQRAAYLGDTYSELDPGDSALQKEFAEIAQYPDSPQYIVRTLAEEFCEPEITGSLEPWLAL